ncbi:amino-acid acetyltransferase, mitochondrial [Kwoniella mangroviensis CBS 8886]|uniref:amino-acid acetyltransferase, mitochondrial n=1 Tax=Kwoniella mangroviensis CBS 8507 TaxID=1296122 RepID=UPI00080D41FF|nr:amino-acid acetyltransferase, mitochondrial [Kwoniella mangroviensis CBS 8507]OCF63261.1 amino-acid acetyltransferase, mitochondrial [Kwoniella mangroviensis CBS 8507]OCF73688.1 amino-acid acetyltransferase, mitochondrial [Kwoniella mangroviensis CBS 8886]
MKVPIQSILTPVRNHALAGIRRKGKFSPSLIQRSFKHDSQGLTDIAAEDNDFILSILQASPSVRDSRSYLSSFAPPPSSTNDIPPPGSTSSETQPKEENQLVNSLLNPIIRRPALVKIQGPFTDAQLDSICRGMAYLQKLGLVSVIVVDRDDLPPNEPKDKFELQRQRAIVRHEVERVVHFLTRHRAIARPIFSTVARIHEVNQTDPDPKEKEKMKVVIEEEGLDHVRRAVQEGEIPVLLPVALDEGCKSTRIQSNKVLLALAKSMSTSTSTTTSSSTSTGNSNNHLTPLRLLIINKEGGIPSYARQGLPHLSINLSSEYTYINRTFQSDWKESHPTALANLNLANGCLEYMPKESSALIVSHRSPSSMIANLITNKPKHSASLPHSLLQGITRDTPTIIRKGLPVRVLRSMEEVNIPKLTNLLETSFKKKLNHEQFYGRLKNDLDFVIVVGDYAGAAIVTMEGRDNLPESKNKEPICYLDKFAVNPLHQGDGTVDFLWVALRDETYGLGLLDASNPSIGSLRGVGTGKDLVWRSRSDNPINKWYFERSNGFKTTIDGKWKVFWCDAEQRLKSLWREREFGGGRLVKVVEDEEKERVEWWEDQIGKIPSAWK